VSSTLFLRLTWRALRGAPTRFAFFAACLALGVAAVVAVAALASSIEAGLHARSRELLGGDLALESRRPLPDVTRYLPARDRDAARVELTLLPTMVRSASGQSQLAELKAVDETHGTYPLAGVLSLSPARPMQQLLDDRSVLVARELLDALRLEVGDTLQIGRASFRIAGEVLREPDPISFTITLGPRVLLRREALVHAELLGFGTRVRYRTVLSLPRLREHELAALKQSLVRAVPGGGSHVTIETRSEAQPALRSSLARVQHYFALVALLSLLVASVGVAQIVSAWLAQAVRDIAIMRCLGMSPGSVLWLYLGQVGLVAVCSSGLGAALGTLSVQLLERWLPSLPGELAVSGVTLAPIALGLALGTLVPLSFCVLPLLAVYRVSPLRALRSEAAPLVVSARLRASALAVASLGLLGSALWQSRAWLTALSFSAGVVALTGLLWLASRALLYGLAKLPRVRLPPLLWHGAAALTRPGASVQSGIVALGLGTLVVVSLSLIGQVLGTALVTALPRNAPSVFLVDVQPDQLLGVTKLARELGATEVDSVPVAMARLTAIDGRSTDQLVRERPGDVNERTRAHWVLTREQRMSWMARLPPDNRIVAGALWSDPRVHELSVERSFAKDLGVKLGSVLRFDLQGVPVEFTVTSLRSVEWRSFSSNFFLVAEPGVLDRAPHVRLGAVRIDRAHERALQDRLAEHYPNITVLRVRELLERASDVLAQVALAVQFLGAFTIVTGLMILLGAIVARSAERQREVALLRALGVSRRQIVAMAAIEHALRGGVAGVVGAGGAYVLALTFARGLLEVEAAPSVSISLLGAAVVTSLSVVGGLCASARALFVAPLRVLRR
jgi:putative ABC transport system permease protein